MFLKILKYECRIKIYCTTRKDSCGSGDLLNAFFNGKSDLKPIEGVDFIYFRPSNDSSLGGHEVDTWENMLKIISDFLNKNND